MTAVSAGPAAIECWFVEDAGRGSLNKKPASLLLRQGPMGPPPRPDLDPKLYFKVDGESSELTCIYSLFSSRRALGPSFPLYKYVWVLPKSLSTLLVCAFQSVYSQHVSSRTTVAPFRSRRPSGNAPGCLQAVPLERPRAALRDEPLHPVPGLGELG